MVSREKPTDRKALSVATRCGFTAFRIDRHVNALIIKSRGVVQNAPTSALVSTRLRKDHGQKNATCLMAPEKTIKIGRVSGILWTVGNSKEEILFDHFLC